MHPTANSGALIEDLAIAVLNARRVRYCVASQADFAHFGSNGLPVFNTP